MSTIMNAPALAYWRHTGYSDADLLAVCRELDSGIMLMKVDFHGGDGVIATITSRTAERREGHFPTMSEFFGCLQNFDLLKEAHGSVLVWLEDGMWDAFSWVSRRAPLMAFARQEPDPYTFLIPDPAYVHSAGYEKEQAEIDETDARLPWEQKRPVVFWRGANTGVGIDGPDWKDVPRARLALCSKELGDRSRLDACFSKVVEFKDRAATERIYQAGLVGAYAPFKEFLEHRYQVDVDGFSCAWMSLFMKLSSQCTVLKVQSHLVQWYYHLLSPWEHYIPLRSDLEDLRDIIAWLPEHQPEARAIAECGRSRIRAYTFNDAVDETAQLVSEILSCQRR